MPGWWCSTRSMPPSAAPPSAPAPNACARNAAMTGGWCSNARGQPRGRHGARAGERRRPLGRRGRRDGRSGMTGRARVRLVKGSHIVVPRLFDHDSAYIFQNPDGRVVFAIPYRARFHADRHDRRGFQGRSGNSVAPSGRGDQLSLRSGDREYFRQPVAPDDVVWTFAGVRALYDDGSAKPEEATRDYHLDLDKRYRRGAAAHRLWRQDHDLPAAGGSRPGEARAISSRSGRPGPRARRCRAAIFPGTASRR